MPIRVETTTDSVEDVKRSVPNAEVVETSEEATTDAATTEETTETKADDDSTKTKPKAGAADTTDKTDDTDKPKKDAKSGAAREAAKTKDDDDEDDDEEEAPKHQRPGRNQRKINRLTRELESERQRREAAEQRLNSTKPESKTDDTRPATVTNYTGEPEPQLEDFASSENPEADFHKALGRWSARQEIAKERYESAVTQERAHFAEMQESFNERLSEAKEMIPDWDEPFEDLEKEIDMNGRTQYFVLESEVGPYVLRWFAQHEKQARKLFQMHNDDPRLIRELARIEVHAEGARDAAVEAAKGGKKTATGDADNPSKKTLATSKNVSKAPPPPNRINGNQPPVKTLRDLAGPDATHVDHIKFDSNYERIRKEQRHGRA